jgi:hypothetical protein
MTDSYHRLRLFVAFICLLCTPGCATRYAIEEATGERALYEFKLVNADAHAPMVYWRESPRHIETALNLALQLEGCQEIRAFVNRFPEEPIELSLNPVAIAPIEIRSRADEAKYFQRLPTARCAVLVTLGVIQEELFTGLSFSTASGVILRHRTVIQGSLKGRGSMWAMAPLAALFDLTKTPVYVMGGSIGGSADEPTQPVTVIFEFPEGRREQTELTHDEAEALLRKYYPMTLSTPMFPFKRARAWARAALAKLNMEFSEKAFGDASQDEWVPQGLELKMINGYWGEWEFSVETYTDTYTNLIYGIGNASLIRFRMKPE